MKKIILLILAAGIVCSQAFAADFSSLYGKYRVTSIEGGCKNSGSTFFFDGNEAIVTVNAACGSQRVSGKLEDATGKDDGSIWFEGQLKIDGKSAPCGVVITADKSAVIDLDGAVHELGKLVK